MNRLLTLAIALITLISCSTTDKAVREQQKQLDRRLDSIKAIAAADAIRNHNFIIAADRVTFKHGGTFSANPTINFISMQNDKGTIQLASPAMPPGPNGIGGFTLSGQVRNIHLSYDKKGNAMLTYVLSGMGLTADVTVRLPKGKTMATAVVDAGYSTAGMTVDGRLSPFDPSSVVKGRDF